MELASRQFPIVSVTTLQRGHPMAARSLLLTRKASTNQKSADAAARARALRRVAENHDFELGELNRAFVLTQYFGYLRRNPNDPPEPNLDFVGYNFWLDKLNAFSGNFIEAEMVKAFLSSEEYRHRFGP